VSVLLKAPNAVNMLAIGSAAFEEKLCYMNFYGMMSNMPFHSREEVIDVIGLENHTSLSSETDKR